ncbi:hypothetical protein ACPPVU_10155 [Mucilaginibacter sp. McL0603]|uniref:hypothetical protein n=1 Tax=Mucilaginibacter sp. McL0603 TaxID=3415670 RepID=UPI003CE9DC54
MNQIELLFKDKGVLRRNVNVYPKQIAIDFINECRKHNIGIWGIDAFIIKENFHQPSMNNSIDFTASPFKQEKPENVWDTAIAFLRERDDVYYYEIVCEQ